MCHAVSHDGKFGKGLAKLLDDKFDLRREFLAQKDRGCPGLTIAHRGRCRTIVNAITKVLYYDKPTVIDVEQTMINLKHWLAKYEVKEICMPEFSCGLDKMKLPELVNILFKVFGDMDLTIYMYHYEPDTEIHWKTCITHCNACIMEDRDLLQATPEEIVMNWTTVAPDGVSAYQMVKDQKLDPNIMPIVLAVMDGHKPHLQEVVGFSNETRALWYRFNSLFMDCELLFKRQEHHSGDKNKETAGLILPQKHVKRTIMAFHCQLGETNHFGIKKTLKSLKRFFWWPGMHNDVIEAVSNCVECRKVKGPLEKVRVPLKIFQDGVLHGRWHVDTAGPYPETKEKFKYILVAIEALSGWPVIVPLKTQTAKEIAQALITHVFSVYGSPISILTDRAQAFESSLFHEIMELYHIKKYRTTAYHPSANGKAERWVRTMKENLKLRCDGARDKWVEYLPFITQAYRSLPHSTHKFSPYEVMFGAPMRTPLTLVRGPPPLLHPLNDEYPWAVRNALSKIHEEVRKIRAEAATKMKAYYDLTASLAPFQVGDQVFLYDKALKRGESPKLHVPWVGPYTVLTIINDCDARIQKIGKPSDVQIVHMDRLSKFPGNSNEGPGAWLNYTGTDDSDKFLVFEARDKRKRN